MSKIARKTIVSVVIVILALSIAAFGFVACNKKTDVKGEVKVTDMIGREVAVTPGSYQRVVCIGAGALRMYSYIGDVSLLAGVEDIENTTLQNRPKMFDQAARPYQLANKAVFDAITSSCGVGGPQAQAAEAEKILACNPDIVISEYEDVEKADALQEQLGVPVVTLSYGANGVFDENVKNSFTLLGKIFGKEQKAATLNEFIAAQTKLISDRTANVAEEDKPSVYICGLGQWGKTDHLFTAQNYAPFNVAHIKNVISGLSKDGIQPIEKEKFEAIAPRIDIFIFDAAATDKLKSAYSIGAFENVKAFSDGKVYLEMAYNAYYTNLEIALINTWYIAKVAYPTLFEDINMTEKTNEVTRAFLGKDLAEAIFACPLSAGGYQTIDLATFFA